MKKILFSILFVFTLAGNVFSQDIFDAARSNDTLAIRQYLKSGLKIDTTDNRGSTPLIIAVYNENEAAAGLLLSNGASAGARDRSGNTALMGACFKGYLNMVKLLFDHHSAVNDQNFNNATALIFASTFGHYAIVSYLLAKGADTSIRDRWGKTALDYAINQENNDIIELLNKKHSPAIPVLE